MGLVSSIQPLAAAEMTDRDLTGGAEHHSQEFTAVRADYKSENLITTKMWGQCVCGVKGIYCRSEGVPTMVPTTPKWRLPVSEVKGRRRLVEY